MDNMPSEITAATSTLLGVGRGGVGRLPEQRHTCHRSCGCKWRRTGIVWHESSSLSPSSHTPATLLCPLKECTKVSQVSAAIDQPVITRGKNSSACSLSGFSGASCRHSCRPVIKQDKKGQAVSRPPMDRGCPMTRQGCLVRSNGASKPIV